MQLHCRLLCVWLISIIALTISNSARFTNRRVVANINDISLQLVREPVENYGNSYYAHVKTLVIISSGLRAQKAISARMRVLPCVE